MTRGETILQDIRFAVRTARKTPGFMTAAICTLALGIGANTVIFSIVSGVLLRPLPFADPDRLVQLNQLTLKDGAGAVSYPDLEEWRKQSRSFEAMIAYGNIGKNLQNVAEPERIATVWAERGLFRMLGVESIAGRTFREDDPANVAVLGAGIWKRRFGGDLSTIGKKITLDGEPYTVIGVMPQGFQFPYRASNTELWIPWDVPRQYAHSRNYRVDFVAGRLKTGTAIDTARNELGVIARRLETSYPETNKGRRAVITPLSEVVTGRVRPALLTLLGAVGMVLLIACANVMNLLLARAAGRTHEIALRAALGAGRGRLIQQLLTESVLMTAAGGVVGLLLALNGTGLLLNLAASRIPRLWEIGLDWRVFFFLLAVCVATGIAFGLVPALALSRINVPRGLKEASGSRYASASSSGWSGRKLRDGLVVAEIAMAFVLLMGAGVLLRAFLHLQSSPAGFVADNVLTLQITISLRDYSVRGSYGRYLGELEERLGKTHGVRAVGFIQYLPLRNWGWTGRFSIAGQPPRPDGQQPSAELRYVSPGYFRALGIPILKGRAFTNRDTIDAPPVIMINQALAHKYFPSDPIGQRTDRGTIVGVSGDVRQSGLDHPATPEIYYPFAQNTAATSEAGVSLVVSTQAPAETLVRAVTDAVHEVNPHQVVFNVKTMRRVVADSLADLSLYLWLIGVFAVLAVLLAITGIYGVVSHSVATRRQEFGIRIALGATSGQLVRLVLGHSSRLVAYGLIAGVAGTLALMRTLKSLLSSVSSTDAAILLAVSTSLATVALVACLIPARRAMQVDPNVALRHE